jgi:hypothetical protein
MLQIRAFRAVDDHEACEKYIEGHSKLLKIYFGINQITSAKTEWATNPASYVVIAESPQGDKVYGGARIQVVGGTQPLPIEDAAGKKDVQVLEMVREYGDRGSGELCGLWNSREVAGMGLGSIFLGRVGVALVSQLKLTSLFALCAPYTVDNCMRLGFAIETSLGNNGIFFYPHDNFVATALMLKDVVNLPTASQEEREAIFDLRKKPIQKKMEPTRRGEIEIDYHLNLSSFHHTDPEFLLANNSQRLLSKMIRPELKH